MIINETLPDFNAFENYLLIFSCISLCMASALKLKGIFFKTSAYALEQI